MLKNNKISTLLLVLMFSALMAVANAAIHINPHANKKILTTILTPENQNKFPNGCVPVGYIFKLNTLTLRSGDKGSIHSIYFIHNKYAKPINLYQMRNADEPYIIYVNNKISTNQWAVFATSEQEVRFICAAENGRTKYGDIVDCGNALQICEFPNVEFSINNHGEYWAVSSNPSAREAVREVIRQGVLLRW